MDGKREEEVNKTNMELETSESSYPGSGSLHIPIDLFGSKKHAGAPRGVLAFADALGNILFTVNRHPPNRNYKKKLLLDASGNIIFSIYRHEVSLCFHFFSNIPCLKLFSQFRPEQRSSSGSGFELWTYRFKQSLFTDTCHVIFLK